MNINPFLRCTVSELSMKNYGYTSRKKRILIVFSGSMELGGIERSLIGLLDSIDYHLYDVDLFLYSHRGPLFSLINPNVNILPEIIELAWLRKSLVSKMLHGAWYSTLFRVAQEICLLRGEKSFDQMAYNVNRRYFPVLNKEYDLAICFFRPFDMLATKIKAKKNVGWIHTDYRSSGENLQRIEADYSRLETIVAVSEECAAAMAEGARRQTGADIAVSVTGIAGPGGGTPEKPVGTVCFGVSTEKGTWTETRHFSGKNDRAKIRRLTANHAMYLAIRTMRGEIG